MKNGPTRNPEWAWRKTAQLRDVTHTMKRAKDALQRRQGLEEFDAYQRAILAGACQDHVPSPQAILAGFQACWARGDLAGIAAVAAALPPEWLLPSDMIGAYAAAAAAALTSPRLRADEPR